MCITCAFCLVPAAILPLFAWLRIKKSEFCQLGPPKSYKDFLFIKNVQNLLIGNLIIIQQSENKNFSCRREILFSVSSKLQYEVILNKAATGVWRVCTYPICRN
jgi:hypothetical protein